MNIYLLRHAEAEDFARTDSARQLTDKGRSQAERVAEFIARDISLGLIISSPILRALDTARAVERRLGGVPLLVDDRLACGMRPETGLKIIREHEDLGGILLVGHQPDLGGLASRLLSKDDSMQIQFRKAALASIDLITARAGAGVLEFFIPCSKMAGAK